MSNELREPTMTNLDRPAAAQGARTPRADQRLARKCRFDDPNMDLFFLAALGWGKSGGLDVGEAFEIASHVTDGDADSWIRAFEQQAKLLDTQADVWADRGWTRAAGEMRLKAFA